MQQRSGSWGRWLVVAATVGWAAGAHALQLYVGLPGGRSIAFARSADGWARVGEADLPDVGNGAFPALGDLDGDGAVDAVVGTSDGHLLAFENTGSTGDPTWTRRAEWDPPQTNAGALAPALVDLSGDGVLDLLVGTNEGDVLGFQQARSGQRWQRQPAWDQVRVTQDPRPACGDLDGDGRTDLLVGGRDGTIAAFAGTGSPGVPFVRRVDWDLPRQSERIAPAVADLDRDGRLDVLVGDGFATMTVLRNTAAGWELHPEWAPADPGSGPAVPVFVAGDFGGPPPPADGTPRAQLTATPRRGVAPLRVTLDASGSSDPNGDALRARWDFGDGATVAAVVADPGAAIQEGDRAYDAAKRLRDDGHHAEAVSAYLAVVTNLLPLVAVAQDGPVSVKGTSRIDRVARWYLQKIAHDLGGVYLYRSLGLDDCERYGNSLQYSRESARQAVAGGFPNLPALNGTNWNIGKATEKLRGRKCPIPEPKPMFESEPPRAHPTDLTVEHVYTAPGRYTAMVTISDGALTDQATVVIDVTGPDGGGGSGGGGGGGSGGGDPPPDGEGGDEPYEGFGASTRGGEGEKVIRITEATEDAVRAAFKQAADGHAIVSFEVQGPIAIDEPLPQLRGPFVTLEGNGVTLVGTRINRAAPMIDVRGHDVIVRNFRLRSGGDNLRLQGDDAYNIVLSHLSSTGAGDDGLSIGYGAHDITVQYCFLAGNTRSMFLKYGTTTNISIHHVWMMKQWIRGPLVSGSVLADLRNVIVEDWAMWGARFEDEARGNVINSLFILSPYARSIGGKPGSALRVEGAVGPVFMAGNSVGGMAQAPEEGAATAPVDVPPVTTLPMSEMVHHVRARAGCLPHDEVDRAYVMTGTGWRIGRYEPFRINP